MLREDVVLGDEVAGARVQTSGQEAAHDEVGQGSAAGVLDEDVVEGELDCDVEELDLGEGQLVDHHWAQGVEEDLEGAEEGFAGDRVEEERFEGRWEVSIESIDAQ